MLRNEWQRAYWRYYIALILAIKRAWGLQGPAAGLRMRPICWWLKLYCSVRLSPHMILSEGLLCLYTPAETLLRRALEGVVLCWIWNQALQHRLLQRFCRNPLNTMHLRSYYLAPVFFFCCVLRCVVALIRPCLAWIIFGLKPSENNGFWFFPSLVII